MRARRKGGRRVRENTSLCLKQAGLIIAARWDWRKSAELFCPAKLLWPRRRRRSQFRHQASAHRALAALRQDRRAGPGGAFTKLLQQNASHLRSRSSTKMGPTWVQNPGLMGLRAQLRSSKGSRFNGTLAEACGSRTQGVTD
jgi:hypothetical protein